MQKNGTERLMNEYLKRPIADFAKLHSILVVVIYRSASDLKFGHGPLLDEVFSPPVKGKKTLMP